MSNKLKFILLDMLYPDSVYQDQPGYPQSFSEADLELHCPYIHTVNVICDKIKVNTQFQLYQLCNENKATKVVNQ